jgi:hypothetical protein
MPILRDLEAVEVSLVPKAANLKKFLIFKSAEKIKKADNVTNAHATPPKGKPQSASQYADPAHFKYPIDQAHVASAVSYFNHPGAKASGGYSEGQWATIGGKISSAANKLIGKGHSFKNDKIAIEEGITKVSKSIITDVMKSIADTNLEKQELMDKILKQMDVSPEAQQAAEVACKLLMAYKDELPDDVFAGLAQVAGYSDGSEDNEDEDEDGGEEDMEDDGEGEDGEDSGQEMLDESNSQGDEQIDDSAELVDDSTNDNMPGQEQLAGVTNAAAAPVAGFGNKPGVAEGGAFPDTATSQFSQPGVPNSPQPPDMPKPAATPGKPETSAFGGQAAAKPTIAAKPGVPEKPNTPVGGLPVAKMGKPLYKSIGGEQGMKIMKAADIDSLKVSRDMKKTLLALWKEKENQAAITKSLSVTIKKMEDEKAISEFVSIAKSYKNLSVNTLELGAVLKGINDINPEYATKIQTVLKSTNEQLRESGIFKEIGSAAMGETGSPSQKMNAIAKEKITKSDGKMTKEQAYVQALEENPEIYRDYKIEHDGRY